MNGLRARLAITIAAICAVSAHAKNEYLFAAGLFYPEITSTELYNCSLCHSSGDNRNPFGMDFEASGHNFQSIEDIDSDSDGFSNIVEIESLTWPGNPLSFPFRFGTVNVKKPNGGEAWTIGSKAKVTWTTTGDIGDEVSIELWQNGQKVKTLKRATPNDGKQAVKLKSSLPAGAGYTIRVRSLLDKSIVDESNAPFSLVAP